MLRWVLSVVLSVCLLPVSPAFAKAPSVVLKDFTGRDRNVNEYIGKGKWTVVAFWAHDCPICRQEIHHMVFFHDAHRKKDATVLGVSVDGWANRKKAQLFIDNQALNFPNLIADPDAIARFGAGTLVGTPTFYIYRPDGRLAGKNVGPLTQDDVEAFIKSGGKRAMR